MKLVPIKNFDGYWISDTGEVMCMLGRGNRDKHKKKSMYFLKPRPTTTGYMRVCMRDDTTHKRVDKYIHRLVAEAFIDNPEDKKYVNHKNCRRDDNRAENLEWSTAKENTDQTENLGHVVRDEYGRYVSNFDYEL